MKTFAEKQNQRQQKSTANLTKQHRLTPPAIHEVHPLMHLQRTIGNQAVLRFLQAARAGAVKAEPQMQPLQLSPSGERIAGQPAQKRATPGKIVGKPVVLGSRTSDQKRKTRVSIQVTGHASPRWRGAPSAEMADANNLALSQRRENAVLERVKQILREELPDEQLVFESAQSTSLDKGFLDDRATIDIDSNAVGSQQTLQEAGTAGRRANEPSMLRVDLSISLSDAIDTIQETKIKEKRQLSGATQDWAIKMGAGLEAGAGFGGGGFNFMLKNKKNQRDVEGWAAFGSSTIGTGLPIPTIDIGGYEHFRTRQPANFSDFHGADINIITTGFHFLFIGYEWSGMTISGLPGGEINIDVGGFSMGGASIDVLSGKGGKMWLREIPDTYNADVVREEQKVFTSRMTDERKHRVLFKTGEAYIPGDEGKRLWYFINSVVENYQRGDVTSYPP